jgi:hypothetical protein
MILSKNELRSSSGRIRYRVRVQAGIEYGVTAVSIVSLSCPTTVSYIWRCSTIPVPPVPRASACSTIRVPLSHYSDVRCPVRLFAVRCFRSCARVRCALFSRCSHAREFTVRYSHVVPMR